MKFQCKHINTAEFLELIQKHMTPIGASIFSIALERPDWPDRVVIQKGHILARKGYTRGCPVMGCYCRGDYTLAPKGLAMIEEKGGEMNRPERNKE